MGDESEMPKIGDEVRYISMEKKICYAVITEVWTENCVNLNVFSNPDSGYPDVEGRTSVIRGRDEHSPGCWIPKAEATEETESVDT
jgi:hypothetical protein